MGHAMMRHRHIQRNFVVAALCLGGCNGIIWETEDRGKAELGMQAEADLFAASPAVRDTIGSLCFYEGMRPLAVRGYGLVVGLGSNGSRDCPKQIRETLVQNMYKQQKSSGGVVGVERITPEQLIDDEDTAVVLCQGEIPAGALAGTQFDVAVTALPGTQTKSLRGGRLFTTELDVFRSTGPNTSITGQSLAYASGPMFLNPFAGEDSATKIDPRNGVVLGGGTTTQDRRIRLVLGEPSYVWARKIRDRINAQFPGSRIVADAISPSFVQLRIPPEFAGDEGHFLALVRGLYLSRDPGFEALRAQALGEELQHPGAPHALIALSLEGLGRPSVAVVNKLYTHSKDYVSFHAAVAGLRLGDHLAADALTVHADSTDSEFRFRAIRALGEAKGVSSAAISLRRLLHDPDPRVQVAAYEALIRRGDVTIASVRVDDDNFTLDRVPMDGESFIYAKRTGERRIVLFDHDLKVAPPVFYRSPDGSFTLTADRGDRTLTVVRVVVSSGAVSPSVPAPLELMPLLRLLGAEAQVLPDGEVIGLGLDYASIVRALHHLCNDGSINGKFMLEQPNITELFGPPEPSSRPESES